MRDSIKIDDVMACPGGDAHTPPYCTIEELRDLIMCKYCDGKGGWYDAEDVWNECPSCAYHNPYGFNPLLVSWWCRNHASVVRTPFQAPPSCEGMLGQRFGPCDLGLIVRIDIRPIADLRPHKTEPDSGKD